MKSEICAGSGDECNRVQVGGTTILYGDKTRKPEKPYTIIIFPGGDVEIARCDDGTYWVHVAVRAKLDEKDAEKGQIIDARMDHSGRYNDEGNAALRVAVKTGDVEHIAFLIAPPGIVA